MKPIHCLNISMLSLLTSFATFSAKAEAYCLYSGYEIIEPTLQSEVNRIFETRTCEACILFLANLSDADLSDSLFRRSDFIETQFNNTSLVEADLSNACMTTVYMVGADLRRANLHNIFFDGVVLDNANLTDVNLSHAKVTGSFENANLSGANFTHAQIVSADFQGADLTNTNFTHAEISRAYLINADLTDANLDSVTFEQIIYDSRTRFPEGFSTPQSGAFLLAPYSSVAGIRAFNLNLVGQDLTGLNISNSRVLANFSDATLSGSNFENTNANESDFTESSLVGVRFYNTQLRSTDLTGANLQGADLRGADLTRAVIDDTNFRGAIYNAETKFPEGFAPEAAGAIFFDEATEGCSPIQQ